jgi:hypothetical protein
MLRFRLVLIFEVLNVGNTWLQLPPAGDGFNPEFLL